MEKQIKEFEEQFPRVTSGRLRSTATAFAVPFFTIPGMLIAFALIYGFSDQAHHGVGWILQDIKKNGTDFLPQLFIAGVIGFILGLIAMISESIHNSHCDDYENLLTKRKQLKEQIQRRTSLTGRDSEA